MFTRLWRSPSSDSCGEPRSHDILTRNAKGYFPMTLSISKMSTIPVDILIGEDGKIVEAHYCQDDRPFTGGRAYPFPKANDPTLFVFLPNRDVPNSDYPYDEDVRAHSPDQHRSSLRSAGSSPLVETAQTP